MEYGVLNITKIWSLWIARHSELRMRSAMWRSNEGLQLRTLDSGTLQTHF